MPAPTIGGPAHSRATARPPSRRSQSAVGRWSWTWDAGPGCAHGSLLDKVGPQGSVVGIEESPEMVAVARERIDQEGWSNVTVVQSSAEDAQIALTADAALFCAVHDILQSQGALRNVLSKLRPGAQGGRWRRQVGRPVDDGREHASDDAARSLCAELRGVPAAVASSRATARGRAGPRASARQRLYPDRPGAAGPGQRPLAANGGAGRVPRGPGPRGPGAPRPGCPAGAVPGGPGGRGAPQLRVRLGYAGCCPGLARPTSRPRAGRGRTTAAR